MSPSILGAVFGDEPFFLARQLGHQRIGNVLRDEILDVEYIGETLIEFARPQAPAVFHAYQLGGDPYPFTCPLNTPVKHMAYFEFAARG
jgi:hypothetical protein